MKQSETSFAWTSGEIIDINIENTWHHINLRLPRYISVVFHKQKEQNILIWYCTNTDINRLQLLWFQYHILIINKARLWIVLMLFKGNYNVMKNSFLMCKFIYMKHKMFLVNGYFWFIGLRVVMIYSNFVFVL